MTATSSCLLMLPSSTMCSGLSTRGNPLSFFPAVAYGYDRGGYDKCISD